jgi:hypothetical protein
MDSVIKVFCIHTEPNYSLPWQRKRQYASNSSGFIVHGADGKPCILTNAHSVAYFSQVKVKRRGDDRKFLAEVLAVGTECDIALLTGARCTRCDAMQKQCRARNAQAVGSYCWEEGPASMSFYWVDLY